MGACLEFRQKKYPSRRCPTRGMSLIEWAIPLIQLSSADAAAMQERGSDAGTKARKMQTRRRSLTTR
jgi:hypothetical protein